MFFRLIVFCYVFLTTLHYITYIYNSFNSNKVNVVEYNFVNPDGNRIFSIVSETMRKLRKKYDVRKVELKYNTKFYGKIKNKTKNNISKCGIDKTKIASNR